MRVRMRVGVSGRGSGGRRWPARGGVLDVSDAEGVKLCAAGMAEPVPVVRQAEEKAVAPSAETARLPDPERPVKLAAEKRRGRPKLPRDVEGNIVRE